MEIDHLEDTKRYIENSLNYAESKKGFNKIKNNISKIENEIKQKLIGKTQTFDEYWHEYFKGR